MEEGRIAGIVGPASAVVAVSLFLWQASLADGWLEATPGAASPFFWAGFGAWIAFAAAAVRGKQLWWAIAGAPFALYPVVMFALLLAECAAGNCL